MPSRHRPALPARLSFLRCFACAVVCLWTLAGGTVRAGTVKYPADKPSLSLELPAGWRTEWANGPTKALFCVADDGSGVNVHFFTIPDAEIKGDLSTVARTVLEGGGGRAVETGRPGEDTVGANLPARFVRSSFRRNDKQFVSLLLFVPMGGGQTVVIHCFMGADQRDSHKAAILGLLDSVKLAR